MQAFLDLFCVVQGLRRGRGRMVRSLLLSMIGLVTFFSITTMARGVPSSSSSSIDLSSSIGGSGRRVWITPGTRSSPSYNSSGYVQHQRPRSLVRNMEPAQYILADANPVCLAAMSGGDYCPTPSANLRVTDVYMGAEDRSMFALINALRVSPRDFASVYGTGYSCSATPMAPFRYSSPLQQASKQASRLLSVPGCPIQHDTCSRWCNLYRSCSYLDRIPIYSDAFGEVGENLAVGPKYNVKVLNMWMSSEGHCANVFYAPYTHIGSSYWRDDASSNGYKHYWVTDFASIKSDDPYTNPIYSGSHVPLKTGDSDTFSTVRFMATYYSNVAASKVTLVIDGHSFDLALHLGTRAQGSFASDFSPSPGDCSTYYFTVQDTRGTVYRLPEKGAFYTSGIGTCTKNYAPDVGRRGLQEDEAEEEDEETATTTRWVESSVRPLPSYRYVGCRSLTPSAMRGQEALTSPDMTHAMCDYHCRSQGLPFFGISLDSCRCQRFSPLATSSMLMVTDESDQEEDGEEEDNNQEGGDGEGGSSRMCGEPCGGDDALPCGSEDAWIWFQTVA